MNEKYIKLSDLQKIPIRADHYDKEHGNEHFIFGIETAIEYAESIAVDMPDIIRCQDCEYWANDVPDNYGICDRISASDYNATLYCRKDWFCGGAKRRDESDG